MMSNALGRWRVFAATATGATLVLMAGIGIGQVITFAATPWLARIFTPDQFGVLAFFVSTSSVLTVAAAGRFEFAIPLASGHQAAAAVARLGLIVAAVVGVLVVLGAAALIRLFPAFAVAESMSPFVVPLALVVWVLAAWRVYNYWHTRCARFRIIAWSHVVRSLATVALQLGLGLLAGLGAAALIWGYTLGQIASLLVLVIAATGTGLSWRFRDSTRYRLLAVARRHREFARYGTGQALLNSLSQNAAIIAMTHFFAVAVVGQFAFATRILMFPVNLVANGIRQVVYQRMASATSHTDRYRIWRRTTLVLSLVTVPMLLAILLVGPTLFSWFLGSEWLDSGRFARWLVLQASVALVNPPSAMAMPLLELQHVHVRYEAGLLSARVLAVLAGGFLQQPMLAVAAYAVVGAGFNIWLVVFAGSRLSRAARTSLERGPRDLVE